MGCWLKPLGYLMWGFLDEGFFEIGQSGQVWHKEQIIKHFRVVQSDYAENSNIVMFDERFKRVNDEIILLTYTVRKTNLSSKSSLYSLRSSLWKKLGDRWVMIFHQGTPVKIIDNFRNLNHNQQR